MLLAMDNDRRADSERCSDCIGPAARFRPFGAGRKSDLLGPREKLGIAAAMQNVTRIVGKHEHVLRIDDLFEQDIHCRLCMDQQVTVSFHLVGEQAAFEYVELAMLAVVQPIAEAPLPGRFDHRRQEPYRHSSPVEHELTRLRYNHGYGFTVPLGLMHKLSPCSSLMVLALHRRPHALIVLPTWTINYSLVAR